MKDPVYENQQYNATIIYSSSKTERPVNPQFVNRVKYVGSEDTKWKNVPSGSPEKCSVLIHNLKITDSGNYSFRFVGEGKYKWVTNPFTSLTVAGKYKDQNTENNLHILKFILYTYSMTIEFLKCIFIRMEKLWLNNNKINWKMLTFLLSKDALTYILFW